MGKRVAIVGGGITGLALAERLRSRGAEPVVLEAEARVGGKVGTIREGGFLLEAGPNGFLDREPETIRLSERIGLRDKLRPADDAAERRWLFLRGALRQAPGKPQEFLTSDILPWPAKLRVLGDLVAPRGQGDESIYEFGARHMGPLAARDLLGAMVVGIFGGDVKRLSLRSCFPRMAKLEQKHRSLVLGMLMTPKTPGTGGPGGPGGRLTSVEGGLAAYVDRLAEVLGPEVVKTAVTVGKITKREGGGYTLSTGADELAADSVVVATPADEAARLLGPHDQELGSLCGSVRYAPISVVHLGFRRDQVGHRLGGFGYLVPPSERRKILGSLFISEIFPWRAPEGHVLFTVMVGGMVTPELANLSDAELFATVRAEIDPVLDVRGEPSLKKVVRWPMAIPQYEVGHEAKLERIDGRLTRLRNVHLAGNAWRGIGFNDCIAAAGPVADKVLSALA